MTIEQVIEAKQLPWNEYLQLFGVLEWFTILIGFPFLAMFATAICMSPFAIAAECSEYYQESKVEGILAIIVFTGMLIGVNILFLPDLINEYEPENWREEIAIPFYESIPKTTQEIEIISITETQDPTLFQVVYAVKNEDGILVHESAVVPLVKRNVDEPIYEYRYVSEEIPNFKEAGKHEERIIIPSDFSFMKHTANPSE